MLDGIDDTDSNVLIDHLRDAKALLAAALERLDAGLPHGAARAADATAPDQAAASILVRASELKRILQMRARRRRRPQGQFLDWPAWDMLLDLAAVRAEGGHISVSAICISSGAPQSTALRKLASLEGAGLVQRYLHGSDRRRVCLRLTDPGGALVDAMLIEELALFRAIGAP